MLSEFDINDSLVINPPAVVCRAFTLQSALAEWASIKTAEGSLVLRKGKFFAEARTSLCVDEWNALVAETKHSASTIRIYMAMYKNPEYAVRNGVGKAAGRAASVASGENARSIRSGKEVRVAAFAAGQRRVLEAWRAELVAGGAVTIEDIDEALNELG